MDFGPYLLLASLEGAVGAAVLALTAVGLSLVFGVMRVVNVAHGEFYMIGAVVAWFVATTVGTHPALGFVAALIVAPLVCRDHSNSCRQASAEAGQLRSRSELSSPPSASFTSSSKPP